MADDLSLLVKFRGDNSGLKATTADTRLAVSQLRHSFGTELGGAMQTLSASASALQGPMGGVASRISALTSLGAGAAGPLAIVAIGITAIAAAAYGAATAILSLAKSAADFAGDIYDLSQKTNFSAETLSALGVAAKFSGSTLESLSPSLVIFQKNMEKAAEGQKEMSKLFKSLNIDTLDNEKALRQAFTALAALAPGAHQTALSMQFFGRSGKDVLGVIKEVNGNIDAAIAKYDQWGLIVRDEAAAAADQFGDTLEALSMQFTALGRSIGLEVLPVLTVFMEDMSEALTGSRENWSGWADFVKAEVLGVLAVIEGLAIFIASKGTLSIGTAFLSAYDSLANRSEIAEIAAGVIATTRRAAGSGSGEGGGGGGKAKAKRDEIYQAEIRAAKDANAVALEVERHATEQLKLAHEESLIDLEQYYEARMRLSEKHHDDIIVQINKEQAALDAARARGLIKAEEANAKDEELTRRNTEAQNKADEERYRLSFERQQKRDAFAIALDKQLFDIRQATREGEHNRIKDLESKKAIDESEAIARRMALMKEEHLDRLVLLNEELGLQTTTANRKTEIDSEKLASEQRYTDGYKQLVNERMEALQREFIASQPDRGPIAPGKGNVLSGSQVDALGPAPAASLSGLVLAATQAGGAFQGLGVVVQDSLGLAAEHAQTFGNIIASTFGQIGQAVGEAVKSFVLFGSVQGGFKKFAAEVIASIAQMAAVQAVFELAQGLAMLALAYFFPKVEYFKSAAGHFTAAAMFGTIAVGAALVGRGVAGNSFASPSGGTSGGGSTGGGSPASTTPTSIDVGRRKSESVPVINITVVGQATEGFKYMVEKVAVESVRDNGPMRKIQRGEDV